MDAGNRDGTGRWRSRLLLAAVIVVVVIMIFLCSKGIISLRDNFIQTVAVKSPVDGASYNVVAAYNDTSSAADILAQINQKVIDIMRHLKKTYIRGASPDVALKYPKRVLAVKRLLARYNPDNLAENSPFDPEGDSAYSLDKGSLIAICLRDRKPRPGKKGFASYNDGELHPFDILMFVTIHEMAHVAVDVLDHPPIFWQTFKFLLEEAENAGVALFPDYRQSPQRYCGMLVDWNPMFDNGTPTIM